MTAMHFACSAQGGRYVEHSAAMLHSLLECNRDADVVVHYLCAPDVSDAQRRALAGMVEGLGGAIEFPRVPDELVADLPVRSFPPPASWYRVLVPELLPDQPKAIYLDVDTIVVDSLVPLWETDVAGHWLAAVTNVLEREHLGRPAELGLPGPEAYFNAGVMVMNLDEMRRDRTTAAVLEHGRAHRDELLWGDQDALNPVLWRRRRALHPRWNLMSAILAFPWAADVLGADAVAEARRNPAIRHFEGQGSNKPWHYLCAHEMRDLYARHRRATPWPRLRREGVTPLNVARRLASAARSTRRAS